MEAIPSVTPSTPRSPESAGHSPPLRNSMEDADSSATRKRPRLDSGALTMSADLGTNPPPTQGSTTAPTTPPRASTLQQNDEIYPFLSTVEQTPSKVTINVRDPARQSSSIAPASDTADLAALDNKDELANTSEPEMASKPRSPSPNVISVSSSPSRSPEIEVAEVEDINEEPGQTKWRPLVSSVMDAKTVQLALLEKFPYLHQTRDLSQTVAMLASHFEKNPIENGDVFKDLADWIETYLANTESHSPQWYNMFLEEPDFWQRLIILPQSLCKRGTLSRHQPAMLPLDIHQDRQDRQHFQDFLVAFSALALRFLQIDCQTLKEFDSASSTKPHLISEPYLSWLSDVVGSNEYYFWRFLLNAYRYDSKGPVTAIIERFIREPLNGLQYLSQFVKDLLDRSQNVPSVAAHTWSAIQVVNRMMSHYNLLQESPSNSSSQHLLMLGALPFEAYSLFQVTDTTLQTFINKKVSAISHDTCHNLITQLSELISRILISDDGLRTTFIKERLGLTEEIDVIDAPVVAEEAWKFLLLKKCLLEGRMEIRVQGVDTMQQELVKIYREYITNTSVDRQHQIVQFLCDFIISNKLVEYLVGVESHPQLIIRCANVIGFLVINHKYTEADSDEIWKTVKTSQDFRVSDAILQMLPNIITIADYSVLLYLVRKLNEISIELFDGRMINYGSSLLTELQKKWNGLQEDASLDLPPYHLCIRLIREAAVEGVLPFAKRRGINAFAGTQLLSLLALGPSDGDKTRIYNECIGDIAGHTEFATGSISAINALLKHDTQSDIVALVNDFNLTDLTINDFCHTAGNALNDSLTLQVEDERLAIRLELLQSIIIYTPESIRPERGRSLWEAMVGPKAPSDHARESALAMLVTATQMSSKRNPFLDQCIDEYLPQLDPRYFMQNMMSFVQQAAQYESRFPQTSAHEDAFNFSPRVTDILWHISLIAPPNGIERKAMIMLVSLYLDTPKAQRTPKATIARMHDEVVERCINQLTAAASKLKSFGDGTSSGEDEPMVIVASEDEINSQRRSFTRSLMILKELVHGIQTRAIYSPVPQVHPLIARDVEEIKGSLVKIMYQPFTGGKDAGIKSIEIGDLESVSTLSIRLATRTGFSKFTVIAGGQKVNLAECSDLTVRESKLHEKGLILLMKVMETGTAPDLTPSRPLKPLEVGVMNHFQDLYSLLGLEESLATDVLDFLIAFPPHEQIITLLSSEETSTDTVFPPTAPFKAFYSLYTLNGCLSLQLANGTTSLEFIRRGIYLMVGSLTSSTGIGISVSTVGETRAASALVDCLLKYLKAGKSSPESLDHVSSNSTEFVHRLLSLGVVAQNLDTLPWSESLVHTSFAVILEMSVYSSSVWSCFKQNGEPQNLLQRTLLQDSRQRVREGIAKAIQSICTISGEENTDTANFVPYFWHYLASLIPTSLDHPQHSEEFFSVTTHLFRNLDNATRQTLDLSGYVHHWSNLLLKHRHDEFVGRDSLDWVIHGISNLLKWCIQSAKALEKPLHLEYKNPFGFIALHAYIYSDTLLERLFTKHLFPVVSQSCQNAPVQVRVPTLHSKTRTSLYAVMLALSNDSMAYARLLVLVRDLLAQGESSQAWSWGVAQILEDYSYEVNWNFDRLCSIRSSTGYPGLKNLSNTCYLNSLFTQLFMNVDFRKFILSTNIADGKESQRLLAETKTLFGFLQESMLKQVDPQGIADSIVTYENGLIDVAIQMDVDEFYNLLFDRLESQILSDDAKKTFRSFYGGQIVQQIKSKECPHVSERLEPFSAIQCDIQGKPSLIDSLNAYVDGETMEGDNKYSCTSCGCYVDAVKRACLKDIPDNLIFHLKRFDYDISTGNRHKINDRFEFPEKINMSPYNVDYLQEKDRTVEPDIFELVGILVHHGAAESGHYYSYIRERPTNPSQGKTWVEFNDSDVTEFNSGQIPDQCFGGLGEMAYGATFSKTWSAYMLFYQRVSALDAELEERSPLPVKVPVKDDLPPELANRIAVDNERYIRNYCLFDPAHITFARSLLEKLRTFNGGTCSDNHAVEKQAIWFSLQYLDRVLSRSKEPTDFDRMLDSLTRMIGSCSKCCKFALEWVVDNKAALRSLLLRCPVPKVRKDFAKMIWNALSHLRTSDTRTYGFDVDSIEHEPDLLNMPECDGVLQQMISNLHELWICIHLHSRGWDDYFGLLADIASFGLPECFVLLREEFLQKCLEILLVEGTGAKKIRVDNPHYSQFIRLSEKGRRFSLNRLIELLRLLLSRIDLRMTPHDPRFQPRRLMDSGKLSLSKAEEELLHWGVEPGRLRTLGILDKLLSCNQNSSAAGSIVQMMVLAEPQVGFISSIAKTILNGINIDPASLAAPFLNAALTFCCFAPSEARIKDLVAHIAREVDTIGVNGGKEHLDFFINARHIQNQRGVKDQEFFHRLVRDTVPHWAPPLIMYWDEDIRMKTIDLLKTLVFHTDINEMDDELEVEEITSIAKKLCETCLKRVQDQIVLPQKPVEAKSVEQVREVIRHCISQFYQDDTAASDRVTEDAEAVYDALQTLSVEDADDANSDTWNNNSDEMPTDSESENIMVSP